MKILFGLLICMTIGCASKSVQNEATTIPFSLHDNRILIDVMVNGQGPFTFVFDTGGARAHTMTPQLAKSLGLSSVRGKNATGAGNNSVESHEVFVKNYSIGELTLTNQEFDVLDLSTIQKAFGFQRLDGIVGFDVLKRSVTCIDNEKFVLTLKNGKADCFGPNGERIPFRLDHDTPVIRGFINGHETEFVIDTGDRSAFSLFQKYAAKYGLDVQFKNKPEVISGVGVGGPIPARVGKMDEIKLGANFKLNNVLTRLPTTKNGYFAKSNLGGSIGNEILRRFNVILDYSKNEITLSKNSHFEDEFRFVPPSIEGDH